MTSPAEITSATDPATTPDGVTGTRHSAFNDRSEQPLKAHARFGYPLPPLAGADLSTDEPAGDDAPATTDGPFAQYLADVPEEHRPWATEFVKKVEGDTTKRFQEHSEYRKTWEPYEQLGITDLPPDDLASVLEFAGTLLDEKQAPDMVRQLASHYGISLADAADMLDDEEPDDTAGLREQLRQEILDELKPELEPMQSAFAQAERERELETIQNEVSQQVAAIEKERGKDFTPAQRDQVLKASLAFANDKDPVRKGYEFYTSIVSETEQGLVKAKAGEPEPFESGGKPAGDVPRPRSIEEATNALRERLAAEQRVAA